MCNYFLLLALLVGVMGEVCQEGQEELCCFGEKCREGEAYFVLPTEPELCFA